MPMTQRPEFNDINNMVKEMFIQRFGSNIDLDDPTTAGCLAGVDSMIADRFAKALEGGINRLFVDTAQSRDLDDLGSEWSVYRRPADRAFVNEVVTAYVDDENPTIIPAGSDFSTADGMVFHSLSDLKFDHQTVDSTDNNKHVPLTDDDGEPLERLTVQLVSDQPGYVWNVQPDSIVNQDNIDGIYSCTNPSSAVGGNDAEPDSSLRQRIKEARSSSPAFSDNGLISAISGVPDVLQVKLIDNREMQPDRFGNPPKSIHLYTIGGDDQDIASTIFKYLYPTTKTVGSITKNVTAVDGTQYPISFDHAKSVDVYVQFNIDVDDNKFNLDEGPENIRQRVINQFATLSMGDTVMFSKLFHCAYEEPGVNKVSLKIGTDPNNLQLADVSVDQFELAVTHDSDKFIHIVRSDH